MSADLFAAFGDDEESGLPQTKTNDIRNDIDKTNTGLQGPSLQPSTPAFSQSSKQQGSNDDGFDDFGDFETAGQDQTTPTTASRSLDQTAPADLEWDSWTHEQNPTVITTPTLGHAKKTNGTLSRTRDDTILFDAENPDEELWNQAGVLEDEDDGFGDCGSTIVSRPSARSQMTTTNETNTQMTDLLGLDTEPTTHASSRPLQQTRAKPLPSKAPTKPTQAKAPSPKKPTKNAPPKPSKQTEEIWDDFETTPTPAVRTTDHSLPADPQIAVPSALLNRLTSFLSPPSKQTIRPTTIPPPSVLLPLFSSTLTILTTTFLAPLSSLSPDTKSTLLTNPNTASLLKSHHAFTLVLSHILAGRKQRWKRDKHLSQSMSIGPSGARSGMKIAGLDRSEAGREDQVAGDVLAVWNKQVGRLRNVVGAYNAAVGSGRGKIGLVPELAETMPVRIAKGAEGAVVGTQPCALCGLKREERVVKVDSEVEDSFGEWWVGGVNMHTNCAVFWESWKDDLRGR